MSDDECQCLILDRRENESEREWFKRWMCMHHWMQTDYYRVKLGLEKDILTGQLLDLITLMPDTQTQKIVDYIRDLRATRLLRDNTDSNRRGAGITTSERGERE